MSGHAHALAMAALDVNGPEGGPSDWGRDHLASPRGQRTAAEAEDLQGDVGTGLTAHAPRGLLEPCAGTKCTTIRYTANAARLGPYPTGPDRAPSGRCAVWTFPQPHCTWCWSYCVTFTATCGTSCCW